MANSVVLVVVIVQFFLWECVFVQGFNVNVDDDQVSIYRGPSQSLFGYSVLAHQSGEENWILVGAPKSYSSCQPSLPGPPGVLYKCRTNGRTCQQICLDSKGNEQYNLYGYKTIHDKKDGQLLGVSLTRQPGSDGQVVVCAHLWTNQYAAIRLPNGVGYTLLYPQGICYNISARLDVFKKIRLCVGEPGDWWRCLGGASAQFAVDGKTLILGAPGTSYNKGSVITVNGSVTTHYRKSVWGYRSHDQYPYLGPSKNYCRGCYITKVCKQYAGYSLTSGHFTSPRAIEGVVGAPRYQDIGRVYIFDLHRQAVVKTITGEPVNTYFGGSVEAVDLNNDLWSDLLVGAPLYSAKVEKGCVYVYQNDKRGGLELQHKLFGSNVTGAKFGSAIKNVGDLNQDGFQDVAIGAPFEDSFGAVYIYNGGRNGINTKYSQRISGKTWNLTSFGSSLSGELDLDGNGYPDLIVGAHQNDSAVYFKSRPVANVRASLTLNPGVMGVPARIPISSNVTVCLTYTCRIDAKEPSTIGINYNVEADYHLYQDSSLRWSPRVRLQPLGLAFLEEEIQLQCGHEMCMNHLLSLKPTARDFLSPIPIRLSYQLSRDDASSMGPVLNLLTSNSISEQIGFASKCGDDNLCESKLQIEYSYSLLSGRNTIFLGADNVVYFNINVSNLEEEAHQAKLNITHPEKAVYEAVQTLMSTDDVAVECEPVSNEDGSLPYIVCSIGNPMRQHAKVSLWVRLDIGSLAPDQTVFNVSLAVSTSSILTNHVDNQGRISLPVSVFADVSILGGSSPDQVLYKQDKDYRSPQYLENVLDTVKNVTLGLGDSRVETMAGASLERGAGVIYTEEDRDVDRDELIPGLGIVPDDEIDESLRTFTSVNESVIGPEFTKQFEIANVGPGRIPYSSIVNISIPWRTLEGEWLIFIKSVQGRDGIGTCNTTDLLQQQYQAIVRHYNLSSTGNKADKESDVKASGEQNMGVKTTTFNCETAQCFKLQCIVQPLLANASAVIEITARIWKHSFLKASYGLTEIVSSASVKVQNPQDLVFKQPVDGKPDYTKVQVTVSAEKISSPELPIPSWVIPVSVTSGILILLIATLSLAKLGFFRRKKREQLKERLNQENEQQELLNAQEEKEKAEVLEVPSEKR